MAKKVVINEKVKYDIQKFAITGGIFTAFMFLLITIFSKFFGIFASLVNTLLDIYGTLGYDVSYFGMFLGVVYGFVTGYILWTIYAKIHYYLPKRY